MCIPCDPEVDKMIRLVLERGSQPGGQLGRFRDNGDQQRSLGDEPIDAEHPRNHLLGYRSPQLRLDYGDELPRLRVARGRCQPSGFDTPLDLVGLDGAGEKLACALTLLDQFQEGHLFVRVIGARLGRRQGV